MRRRRKQMSPRGQKIATGVVFLVGTMALLGSLLWTGRTWRFVAGASQTGGTVTGHHEKRQDRTTTYAAIFEFTDEHGQAHQITSRLYTSKSRYEVGSDVVVLYDPADPTRASIKDGWSLWGGPVMLGLFSAAWLGFTMLMPGQLARLRDRLVARQSNPPTGADAPSA